MEMIKEIIKRYSIPNITLICGIAIILCLASCDSNFKEMNKNPNVYNSANIPGLFTTVVNETSGGGIGYGNNGFMNEKVTGAFVQYYASLNKERWPLGKYLSSPHNEYPFYDDGYTNTVKLIIQIISVLKNKMPDKVNQLQIARIWKIYIFHRLTDIYGDIPYFDAGKAFLNHNYKPKFDPQSEIYKDMLKTLDEAARKLDSSKPSYGSADLVYKGDVVKWRRFAYSLMLRLGMRLTKVDPSMAEKWVKKAIAGGVMQSYADNAQMQHSTSNTLSRYADAFYMQRGEIASPTLKGQDPGKMGKIFVHLLKSTNDPRLPYYITLWQGNADASKLPESTKLSIQKGLPYGYDLTTISQAIPGFTSADLPKYSVPNLQRVASESAIQIFQSYGEVQLLLAEAALRGWGPGTPKEHYRKAVIASMKRPSDNPHPYTITSQAANKYLSENPYNSSATFDEQMDQIYTQMYIILFMNNIEEYAEWRRTGYPKLKPTNYPGNETGGKIPRRVHYPEDVKQFNAKNYKKVIQMQGPDTFMTRVWWDKKEK